MKSSHLVLVIGLILAWLANSLGSAKEPAVTVDSVLAKWEEASQKVKTLDAKLTVFNYDGVFGDGQPTITQGRFYHEVPNLGRYEIRTNVEGATNDWSSISEAIIWTGKETLWIDGPARRCTKFSTATIEWVLSQPESKDNVGCSFGFGIFANIGRRISLVLQGPQQNHLLLVIVRADEIRKQFDVTINKSGDEIRLNAVPKRQADKACYREIDVILNAKTYMTVATQVVSPNGRHRTVHQLSDTKVNVRPSDRDQLLAPNPFGFYVRTEVAPDLPAIPEIKCR